MLTVLVATMKGGAGKTTLATNLAAAWSRYGLATALADADRQKSSLRWVRRRASETAPVTGLDWTKEMNGVPYGTRRLVVDSPAGMSTKRVDDLVRLADVILIPVSPSIFDENSTKQFLKQLREVKPVRKGKRPYAIVCNRVKRRTRAAERLDAFVAGLDCEAVGRVPDLTVFPEVAAEGGSIFDVPGQRGKRLRDDWAGILDFVDYHA